MEIRDSARKRGHGHEEIRYAVSNAFGSFAIRPRTADVDAVMYVGPDRNGNPIEVLVIEDDQDGETAIHCMKARKDYLDRLPWPQQ